MNLPAQTFLNLVEQTNNIVCFDIEATGLRGDYGSILCASFKQPDEEPYTIAVTAPGNDKNLVSSIKDTLEHYMCWVTFYGKGFDIKMLNTRLLKHGLKPVEARPHIDMYWVAKAHLLTARKSQAHLLNWLEIELKLDLDHAKHIVEKMTVSADTWVQILNPNNFVKSMKIMKARCESDVMGLEAMYNRMKHLAKDVTR